MRSVNDIRAEFERLDRRCGLDTKNIEIKLNNASSRLGSFRVETAGFPASLFQKPVLTVTISRKVLGDDALFYDTVRHEYAHAAVYLRYPRERHGHDAVWKAVCREVECTPRATVKNEQYAEQRRKAAKYLVRCRSCGAETRYSRAGKIVTQLQNRPNTSAIVCRRCGGHSFELKILQKTANN